MISYAYFRDCPPLHIALAATLWLVGISAVVTISSIDTPRSESLVAIQRFRAIKGCKIYVSTFLTVVLRRNTVHRTTIGEC